MTRLINALNKRRSLLKDSDKGFTLIELLVVVIIIGILAAIAIPVYLGVQNSAKDSGVKSDLANAKTAVIAYQTDNSQVPDGTTTGQKLDPASTELGKYGYTKGSNTGAITFVGTATTTKFCLVATAASDATKFFWVTSGGGVTSQASATKPTDC